jgi:hypothetical protein
MGLASDQTGSLGRSSKKKKREREMSKVNEQNITKESRIEKDTFDWACLISFPSCVKSWGMI